MQDVKIILTDSLTGLSPDVNFLVYDTANQLWYLGNGTTSPTPLQTPSAPQELTFPVNEGDPEVGDPFYVIKGTEQLVIVDSFFDIIFDEDLNYPDGYTVKIKNIAGVNITVKVAFGDTGRIENNLSQITLSPFDAATIVCYNGNYYII